MEPLKLTWTLSTPMVSTHPVHLDALVAFAVTQEALEQRLSPPGATVRSLADDLPLLRVVGKEDSSRWCWAASALLSQKVEHVGMGMWTKRTEEYDFARRVIDGEIAVRSKLPLKRYALQINTGSGIFKNQFKFYPTKHVRELVAWCIGDKARLEELLQPEAGHITNVGAKGRMGHGQVVTLVIEPNPLGNVNWKRRVLPWQEENTVPVSLAANPPYWDFAGKNIVNYVDSSIF